MSERGGDTRTQLVDGLAYLGLWPAAVAGALVAASGMALGRELGDPALARLCAFAFAGTLVVYDVDRLRDAHRDRATAPLRSRFVAQHRAALLVTIALGLAACAAFAAALSLETALLCAGALVLGLLHRRMKANRNARIAYVTGAWLAVVAGLPAQAWLDAAGDPLGASRTIAALLIAHGSAIGANLICSGMTGRRDGGVEPGERGRLRAALALAGVGVLVTLAVAGSAWPLAAIPLSQAIAARGFRSDERYRHALLDASLLAGALVAVVLLAIVS